MTDFVRAMGHTVAATLTRPANATVYAAGQAVTDVGGSYLEFKGASVDDRGGVIQQAELIDLANNATKPDLELWLFDTIPASVQADGVAFAPTNAMMQTLVGVIAFPVASFKVANAGAAAAGNCVCDVTNIGMPFNSGRAANSGTSLYGLLVVRNAYTPVSGEQLVVRLKMLD